MDKKIVVLAGDGIGPEITDAAVKALKAVVARYGHTFTFDHRLMGGCAIDATGVPLPDETVAACKASDGVLLGAVGGPKWDDQPAENRPEKGLLGIRSALGLYANLRPAVIYPALASASPLKDSVLEKGVDVMVVRELIGGIYFGPRGTKDDGRTAYDTEIYSEGEVERIARIAFDLARGRRKHVTSVDKANVLECSRLWRETVERLSREYPEVEVSFMYVDNAAMQLILNPAQFDVMITGNLFGDILSDESAAIAGSLGMMPSASLGSTTRGLYEPIHGSAPDIAGRDIANPLGTILSGALLLRHSLGLEQEAAAIERAVSQVLDEGYRTGDIFAAGCTKVGCTQMGDLVAERV